MVAPFLPVLSGPRSSLWNDLLLNWPFDVPRNGNERGADAAALDFPWAVSEDETQLMFEFDMPGLTQDALDISVHQGTLKISGERKQPEGERRYYVNHLRYGSFEHAFALPKTIDTDSIKAELSGGVLRIEFAKKPESQPRRVEVKVV